MKSFEEAKEELARIVGANNISTDVETLRAYSKDQSFVNPCLPDLVVFTENVRQVQDVIRIANKYRIPVVPYSSGMNLRGAAIPSHGGIILNLSTMNRIMELKEREGWVSFEAGVTYAQLQSELEKKGFRVMIPFASPPSRSVVSSIMEGDPSIAAASFDYGNALHMDMEIVLPTGDVMRWGRWRIRKDDQWNSPAGGGISGEKYMYETLWYGAQGTLGTVTKLVAKVEHLSKVNKILFIPFEELQDAIEPVRAIQRRELGLESFLLNSFNLAAIAVGEWTVPQDLPCKKTASSEFAKLRSKLPRWTYIIHLSGLPYLPEEKVAYEEEDLREICEELNLTPVGTLAGIEGLENIIWDGILHPWQFLKKGRYKGAVCDVAFHTTLASVSRMENTINELARTHGYPTEDIGGYILPIERARSCYCEFDYHFEMDQKDELQKVKRFWLETHHTLADIGVVLAKPYGPVANIIYRRVDPIYVSKLKELKKELDPNNVMNPGKLCF